MKFQRQYSLYKRIVELFFWLLSLGLLGMQIRHFTSELKDASVWNLFLKSLLVNAFFAFSVYINLRLLIPRFLKQKNYIFYTFWLLVTASFSALATQLVFIYPFHFLFT